jgi:RHS repeat-associated protein
MKQQGHKTEGVNRTKTTRFHRLTFTGKEKDEETGYGYFGARYMDHELMTGWLSVDPMADVSPNISPYHYCHWNPIRLSDPTGMLDDEWQLNVRTNELTWVSGKGGALHQTVTCITPDGSSYVQQMDGMLLRAESRWFGGNDYEVNFETGDCSLFFPPLTQIDGICVPMNSNQPSTSMATLTGSFFLSAASAVDNLPKNITVDNYIESYTNFCRTKFNMPNGRLSNAKIAELISNYNSLKTFGKIGKWGGGALSVVGASSEIVFAANNHSTGAWIRAGISSGAAAAGIFCSGPAAPFVATGVLLWGIIDACWGDNNFNF